LQFILLQYNCLKPYTKFYAHMINTNFLLNKSVKFLHTKIIKNIQ